MTRLGRFGAVVLLGGVLAAAASAGGGRTGGTLRVSIGGDFPSLDPAAVLGADFLGGPLLYATCAKLFNYPDAGAPAGARLAPEVAADFPDVSRDRRTYTFTIRRGFRFNTGARVTAASFAHAINRVLSPQVRSPSAPFLRDIVGGEDVLSGRTRTASGVRVIGDRLVIRLTRPLPDLPARLSMNAICAVPTNYPVDSKGAAPPSAGPYYVVDWTRGRRLVLARNPHYRGRRPRNANQIVYSLFQPFDAIALQIERGDADWGVLPPAAHAPIVDKYGVNRSRFFLTQRAVVACLQLNSDRPLFKDNPRLRRAVNFAIDRRALAAQYGKLTVKRTDQYLSHVMPGFREANVYPIKGPDLRRARALARGHTRTGTAVMYPTNNSATALARAQIVQFNLKQIGIDVRIEPFSPQRDPSIRGEPYDILDRPCALPEYLDPSGALNAAFDGRHIRATRNTNTSYFDSPRYNRKLAGAASLSGKARLRAYGRLDIELARDAAPAAPYAVLNWTAFVSARSRCVRLNPAYGLSLGALCLS